MTNIVSMILPARPNIGDIVAVRAVDWGSYAEQHSRREPFEIVIGMIYGEVIAYTEDGVGVAIAPQVFDGGDVRFTLVVPWCTVQQCFIMATRAELERDDGTKSIATETEL